MRRIALLSPLIALALMGAAPSVALQDRDAPLVGEQRTAIAEKTRLAPLAPTKYAMAAPHYAVQHVDVIAHAGVILPACALPIAIRVVNGDKVDTLAGAVVIDCPSNGVLVDSSIAPSGPANRRGTREDSSALNPPTAHRTYRHDGETYRPPNTRAGISRHRIAARTRLTRLV